MPQLIWINHDGTRLFITLNGAGKVVEFNISKPEHPRVLEVVDLGPGTESASYTWTNQAPANQIDGGIALFRNVNQTTPVDATQNASTSGSTLTVPALAPTAPGDLALFAMSTGGGMTLTETVPRLLHAI
jgi:hypothetical protein